MGDRRHWERVYTSKRSEELSWFQPHSHTSLALITQLEKDPHAHIIDVGGGSSALVDDLLASGYTNLSVLDISSSALNAAQTRLGEESKNVQWIIEDVTSLDVPRHSIDVWHDRAVFHFLNDPQDRKRYVNAVLNAVRPGGHVIVSTFSLNGPEYCSGLPVQRYSVNGLHRQFGGPFVLLGHEHETHTTPFGTNQSFIYCYCRIANT